MSNLLHLLLNDGSHDVPAGFRLQRFEVWNWGTFDRKPWVLDAAGGTVLLTGDNGSGKSTLVDGLLTLLVPKKRRNYNQASSSSGKKERDEKSYVQGAYGGIRSEDGYKPKPNLLRDKGKLSVLLAYFSDRSHQQDITLAQVLWMDEGAVCKFFVIANTQLTIKEHFVRGTTATDLKNQLKAIGAEIFDDFSKYSHQFSKQFGLRSEKALELFNQTVSLKEIGGKEISGLNDFVRNYMLEKTDVQEKIEMLQRSCEDLTICHDIIQKNRKQLETLFPIAEEAEKYRKLQEEVGVFRRFQPVFPAFFARRKLALLREELQSIERQLTQTRHQRQEMERRLEDLVREEKELDFAIKQDKIGQRLQILERSIEEYQRDVNGKQKRADNYNRLARSLELTGYSDRDSFRAGITQGETLRADIERDLESLERKKYDVKIRQSELQKQQNELKEELASLRGRKNKIPKNYLAIRDTLIHKLELEKSELPFIGELLRVRPEASEWEGAIERLLHDFGLCVLVPDLHYQAVNAHVNRENLRGRFVYYPVVTLLLATQQSTSDPKRIPARLEIKEENEIFSSWLRKRLAQHFNHVCCDTIEQFQQEKYAITREGLIKDGEGRHEKDDRPAIEDRSKYILGWTNMDTIQLREEQLQTVERDINKLQEKINDFTFQQNRTRQQKFDLENFLQFTDFSVIDWKSTESKLWELQEEKRQLEGSSDRLKQLTIQHGAKKREIEEVKKEYAQAIGDIAKFGERQEDLRTQKEQCNGKYNTIDSSEIDEFAKYFTAKIEQYSMSLKAINTEESDFENYFREQLGQKEKQQVNSENKIEKLMLSFTQKFPDITSEFGASIDSLTEYLALKTKIERDDLPRHEKRFKDLINHRMLEGVSFFKSFLEQQTKAIEKAINELNESLRQIDYTDSTYIELCCEKNREEKIRDFQETLKTCLGKAIDYSAEDNEERFLRIQRSLIDRFKSDEKWTDFVTDVRNWLNFSVSERYRSDKTEKEYYTDSSGKSGGQKVKLAYTILASAIAYQFGVNQNETTPPSFRFVAIDEAFSRSDARNVRYAMELFKKLDLQLLVVTPKDKINVIEPYISSLHLVLNTEEGNYSSIAPLSIEQYRKNKPTNLDNDRLNHDTTER